MKKILLDLTKIQPVNGSKFHGGGKYGIAVFNKLVRENPDKLAVYYDDSLYIDETVLETCKKNSIPVVLKSGKKIIDAAREFGGFIYSPLFGPEYLTDSSIRTITTIHGLRILEMPFDEYMKYYPRRKNLKSLLFAILSRISLLKKMQNKYSFEKNLRRQSSLLMNPNLTFVTVSFHSKYSIETFVPSLRNKSIKVFYSPSTVDDSLSLEGYSNDYGKYFLIVSGDRWLKNGLRGMLALDELFTERPDIEGKVIVTGLKNLSDISIKIKNKERFICLGYVDETELKALYRYAHLLLYPSLNEGFGYPPLEAMHEGCPVIASAIASIPEICGDAVLYFNPYSISEIKMRVLEMENELIRETYIKKGAARELVIRKKQEDDLQNFAKFILDFV